MCFNGFASFKTSIRVLLVCSLLTGVIYPATVTIIGQLLFKDRANGELIQRDDKIIGSALIGQSFSSDKYFWGRPSATVPMPYNAASSRGSNLGVLNPKLVDDVNARILALQNANPDTKMRVGIDMLTTSASGLDPHISVHSALYQVPRIAKSRKIYAHLISDLVYSQASFNLLNLYGSKQINVLQLNIALDNLAKERQAS